MGTDDPAAVRAGKPRSRHGHNFPTVARTQLSKTLTNVNNAIPTRSAPSLSTAQIQASKMLANVGIFSVIRIGYTLRSGRAQTSKMLSNVDIFAAVRAIRKEIFNEIRDRNQRALAPERSL